MTIYDGAGSNRQNGSDWPGEDTTGETRGVAGRVRPEWDERAGICEWAGIKYGTFITWVQKRRRRGAPGQADDKLVPSGTKTEVQWVEAVMEKATAKKSDANPNSTVMIVRGPGGVRLELSEERHVLWAAKLLRHLDVPGPC